MIMASTTDSAVSVATTSDKLSNGVLDIAALSPVIQPGCRVFVHYNGPTDQLSGLCAGMAILDPGASPHPPHRHPEEEFLIIADGTGEIECDEGLFEQLRVLRRRIADERDVPAYVIFSDVALREMARVYPTTKADFGRIPGVGQQKLRDFAEPFTTAIRDYLATNSDQLSIRDRRS